MLIVLVDADNVQPRRVAPVLRMLYDLGVEAQVIASGRGRALRRIRWPADAQLLIHAGWQRADVALAKAYSPSDDPLMLISGDGDFALLAARHPGPVVVVSGAPSRRLRDGTTVIDPAVDGLEPLQQWLHFHDLLTG